MAKPAKKAESKKPNNVRILYLLHILREETDSENGLSLPQIQEKLEEAGISVERKSLYRDFDMLEDYGIEIGKLPTRPVTYYLASRHFEPAQMMLLVDAVQTSKSITKANSKALIKKLKELVPKSEAKKLDARIHVAGRVKMQNESIFTTLDNIQRAMAEKRDIAFKYMQYDVHKNLCETEAQDGQERVRTPLAVIYSNENYYMLAFDEKAADHIRVYRIDRMAAVRIGERSARSHKLPADFDIADYERQVIGMFAGKPVSIKLQVSEDKVGNLIDIFGVEEVECTPAKNVTEHDRAHRKAAGKSDRNWATMRVKATPNPVLFGAIAQFGGDVRILSPKKVVEGYEAHLKQALKAQEASRK